MSEFKDLTICKDAQVMLKKAQEDGVQTAWDRFKKQEPRGFERMDSEIAPMGVLLEEWATAHSKLH